MMEIHAQWVIIWIQIFAAVKDNILIGTMMDIVKAKIQTTGMHVFLILRMLHVILAPHMITHTLNQTLVTGTPEEMIVVVSTSLNMQAREIIVYAFRITLVRHHLCFRTT